MNTILLGCAAVVVLARLTERLAGTRAISGVARADLMRSAIHLGLYCLMLAASLRPLSALVLFLAVLSGFLIADRAKLRVVKETLVFSDIALLGQLAQHPGLYMSHMRGRMLPLLGLALGAAALVLFVVLEQPVPVRFGLASAALGVLLLLAAGWLAGPLTRSPLLLQEPDFSGRTFGLPAALLLQWLGWLRQKRDNEAVPLPDEPELPVADCDIVVLQLESFADIPGRGYPAAPLRNWPRLCGEAVAHGRLAVEITGANTLRTEFSVLTGLTGAALRFDRFNPYLRAGAYAERAWPRRLARLGLRTVLIHPNDARFYGRHRVAPQLGFAHFRALEHFRDAERVGPYISDKALVDGIAHCLEAEPGPAFVFAISMENHGPWDAPRLGDGMAPADAYMTHLRNSDAAVALLVDKLRQRRRRALLVVYGDHLPALDAVGDRIDGTATDYLILDTAGGGGTQGPVTLSPDGLLSAAIGMIGGSVRPAP